MGIQIGAVFSGDGSKCDCAINVYESVWLERRRHLCLHRGRTNHSLAMDNLERDPYPSRPTFRLLQTRENQARISPAERALMSSVPGELPRKTAGCLPTSPSTPAASGPSCFFRFPFFFYNIFFSHSNKSLEACPSFRSDLEKKEGPIFLSIIFQIVIQSRHSQF